MIITKYTILEVELKNNCPECFNNDGLVLSFIQKEKENIWFRKAAKDLQSKLYCMICKTQIFPVRWDEHIERVYEYYKKLVVPKPTRTHYKKRFWITLSVGILILTAGLIWGGYMIMN